MLGRDTTTWRFRDVAASFSGLAGIVSHPETRQAIIDGGLFESNSFTEVPLLQLPFAAGINFCP